MDAKSISVRGCEISLNKTVVMGILNVTPDSFSDGGRYVDADAAVEHAKKMVADGADIIDVGGESTRPGSEPVSEEEELARVLPVVERLVKEVDVPISIDTCKPSVAKACLEAGAHIVNDISGLSDEMAQIASEYGATVVIMHMLGKPKTMQEKINYKDVVSDVKSYLKERVEKARKTGITELIVDPGIGFGKTTEHNIELIKRIRELKELGCPVLAGPSKKSFIGYLTGLPVEGRLYGTVGAVCSCAFYGADIVRVHDVLECRRALDVVDAINSERKKTIAYIGLGSNMGDRQENILKAMRKLGNGCKVLASSPVYETEPVDFVEQPWFLNSVVKVETKLKPFELLNFVKRIEDEMGRHDAIRYGPRNIDLDILMYGDLILKESNLEIPHPRMHERLFALKPLLDIDPNLMHPVLKKKVKELVLDVVEQKVKPIDKN
ncbi:MAG: dihydropteroate synthase [Candidatus Altiarchaeota archaeon]|nr:dihydropteroate synthase [Candidatus Altiarchaeota archaeon]